jgi:hypothetical protein
MSMALSRKLTKRISRAMTRKLTSISVAVSPITTLSLNGQQLTTQGQQLTLPA